MSRGQSPGYPSTSLQKALDMARKIFEADRRNPIDREVAAKHVGYSSLSGASEKALASLAHYGLVEKSGKGELRVTQRAVDALYPDHPSDRKNALAEAGASPQIFKDLNERFPEGVSEEALKSYLLRENFLDRAINPVTKSFLDTRRFLEQEKVFESGGNGGESGADSDHGSESDTVFGGAKVGDIIQWESQGALQLEQPSRVRFVSDDGQWVAVDGSETGIPMSEVIVEQSGAGAPPPPPTFPLEAGAGSIPLAKAETEWMRNQLGPDTKVRLVVDGVMGPKEIQKLIILLNAQKAVLSDDEED